MNTLENIYQNRYFKSLPFLKEKKTKEITTLILTLAALSIFGLFAISPTLATIANLRKQLSDNELVDQRLSEKIANLTLLSQKYNLLGKDLKLIFSSLPQKPDSPLFISQVESIASTSDVKLNRFQTFQVEYFLSQKDLNRYQIFTFSFDAQGKYSNITNFLTSFVNFERVVTVDAISFNKSPDGGLSVNVRGKAYFKK